MIIYKVASVPHLAVRGSIKILPTIIEAQLFDLFDTFLQPHVAPVEGVFRVSGKALAPEDPLFATVNLMVDFIKKYLTNPDSIKISDIEAIKTQLPGPLNEEEKSTVYSYLSGIKLFFTRLHPHLFTPSIKPDCLFSCFHSESSRAPLAEDFTPESLSGLARPQRFILFVLLKYIQHMASFHETSKMTVDNLASIFSATLTKPSSTTPLKPDESRLLLDRITAFTGQIKSIINTLSTEFKEFPSFHFSTSPEGSKGSASSLSEAVSDLFSPEGSRRSASSFSEVGSDSSGCSTEVFFVNPEDLVHTEV